MTVPPAPISHRRAGTRPALVVPALVLMIGVALVLVLVLSRSDNSNVVGSGVVTARVRQLPAFNGVELAAANSVAIHVGGRQHVVIRGEDNLLPLVTTRVANGRLIVDASRGFKTTRSMGVDVTVPTLSSITLRGSGVIRATGSVTRLNATLSGVGYLKLTPLTARDVHAWLSGTGRIDVTSTQTLEAALSGSGAIFYSGSPTEVTKQVTGKGTVSPQ